VQDDTNALMHMHNALKLFWLSG